MWAFSCHSRHWLFPDLFAAEDEDGKPLDAFYGQEIADSKETGIVRILRMGVGALWKTRICICVHERSGKMYSAISKSPDLELSYKQKLDN